MHDLELQLISITKRVKVLLARQEIFGVEIQLVVERPTPAHHFVKGRPVHISERGLWFGSQSHRQHHCSNGHSCSNQLQ
jgi:hypothetical protein